MQAQAWSDVDSCSEDRSASTNRQKNRVSCPSSALEAIGLCVVLAKPEDLFTKFPTMSEAIQVNVEWCSKSSEYKDDGTNILLDANENAYGPGLALSPDGKLVNGSASSTAVANGTADSNTEVDLLGLNRYPDPHQHELKAGLCALRNTHTHTTKDITPDNLFVGVGSDEAIDALIRCFCVPGKDKMLTCPPTYGMYGVSAQVNDVAVVHVPLDAANDFALQPALINERLTADPAIKLVYICSPGNPTATLVAKHAVQQVLEHPTWNGIVVLDEAYIDFAAPDASLAEWVADWPNLVVMQTLSKAFGLAGIRLGAAFAAPNVAQLLNNVKAPYNVASPTAQLARQALAPKHLAVMRANREKIVRQRERLVAELPRVPGVGRFRGGTDSNFVLVEMLDAPQGGKPDNGVAVKVYEALAETKGVVVRFRGKELGCEGCLRITVGTEAEVDRFLEEIRVVLADIFRGKGQTGVNGTSTEAQKRETEVVT
ncbi:hypothetical protein FH972_023622 [Carpinus fangiana]|uniref:histidinol-phosphate transaminase n=1 Tax=Carpinus fangiana TaxID=176857 RepID=A0A5N6KW74_9ROSI|nr:hypothetical protein FH972_023622 [Carpinus fangiana]